MKEKRVKIAGKWERVPEGVTLMNSKNYLRVRTPEKWEHFPQTAEGLKAASALANSIRKEKQTYGQKFGAITDDEKRAIDLWRAYREECEREGCQWVKMSDVMREAVERVRPQSLTPFFPDVSREWLLAKEQLNLDERHLRKRGHKERRFSKYFAGVRIGDITPDKIQVFLDTVRGRNDNPPAPGTIRDYMVCLGDIFNFAVKRGIVTKNPIEAMDKPRVKHDKDPETLSPDEVRRVMEYAAKENSCKPFLPGLVMAIFCGVRPAELARMRHVDLFPAGRNEAYLSRSITKTAIDRRAKLRENVIAWLHYAGLPSGEPSEYILPGDDEERRRDRYTRLLKRLAKGAGVTIPRDSLRHTAATMIAALEGMGEAAEELGNDVRTLGNHYRHSVPREEAEAFFSILPPPSAD